MDASELLGGVQTSFRTNCLKNKRIANAAKKIQSGKGTYKDVDTYAAETGKALSKALRSNLSADKLPDRHMDAETARAILQPTLEDNYNLVADAAEQVQQSLNQNAGNGLKPIRPKLKQDKIDGMISRIDEEEDFDDIAWMLDDPVTNFTQSVADDAVQDNFEFQSEAGMTPKIVRTAESGACKWCQELEGEYDYADVKSGHSDVYRRHENCTCTVEFVPGDGSRQNAHTKEWREDKTPQERIIDAYGGVPIEGFPIYKSVSAKGKNYDVLDLETGEIYNFVEGQHIQNAVAFAGKGAKTPYRLAGHYAEKYGGDPDDWQHCKGIGLLETSDGNYRAEVHWSQCEGHGKHDFFVKKWLE